MNPTLKQLAASLPDEPLWLDTRGSLLSRPCEVLGVNPDDFSDFIVRKLDNTLICIIGKPPSEAILKAVSLSGTSVEVLTYEPSREHVASALTNWQCMPAIIHKWAKSETDIEPNDPNVRFVTESELRPLKRDFPVLIEELLREISFTPISAYFIKGKPVSFCFPVLESETLWDVSIETLPEYQQRGFAAKCARHMIQHMLKKGKRPSWGALETNAASLKLAQKLGFVPVGKIHLFSSPP